VLRDHELRHNDELVKNQAAGAGIMPDHIFLSLHQIMVADAEDCAKIGFVSSVTRSTVLIDVMATKSHGY
jgi:hypothetical protein